MKQQDFQAFLRVLRRSYPEREVWKLLNEGMADPAPKSQALAEGPDIKLIWLPKQCPELNAIDHWFKEPKADISANYQYGNIDEHSPIRRKLHP